MKETLIPKVAEARRDPGKQQGEGQWAGRRSTEQK